MERNLFGMSAVIASCALLIWSIEDLCLSAGPNVSLEAIPSLPIIAVPTRLLTNQSNLCIADWRR